MRRAWGNNTDRILSTLKDAGQLTQAELCRRLGLSKNTVSPVIARLRKPGQGDDKRTQPKRVYIARWVHGVPGVKVHLRPVLALGSLPCAEKPEPMSRQQIVAAYYERKRIAKHAVVSAESGHVLLPAPRPVRRRKPASQAPAEAAAAA